jgi:hypothetical protein
MFRVLFAPIIRSISKYVPFHLTARLYRNLHVQFWDTPDDGCKEHPKHVEYLARNKDEDYKLHHVGYFIEWSLFRFKLINQLDPKISPVYYLTFIYNLLWFGHPHAHHQELNNCSSSLWFYRWNVVIAVLLFFVGPAGPTKNSSTAIPPFQR